MGSSHASGMEGLPFPVVDLSVALPLFLLISTAYMKLKSHRLSLVLWFDYLLVSQNQLHEHKTRRGLSLAIYVSFLRLQLTKGSRCIIVHLEGWNDVVMNNGSLCSVRVVVKLLGACEQHWCRYPIYIAINCACRVVYYISIGSAPAPAPSLYNKEFRGRVVLMIRLASSSTQLNPVLLEMSYKPLQEEEESEVAVTYAALNHDNSINSSTRIAEAPLVVDDAPVAIAAGKPSLAFMKVSYSISTGFKGKKAILKPVR